MDSFTPLSGQQTNYNSLVSCIDESGSPWPGFVYRYSTTTSAFSFNAYATDSIKYESTVAQPSSINIERTGSKIYLDGTERLDFASMTKRFNVPLTFGASLNGNGQPYRYFKGNVSDIVVAKKFNETKVLTLPVPTLNGYIFNGWNTKADGSGETMGVTMNFSQDLTLYAQWEKEEEVVLDTYDITFNYGDLKFTGANYLNTGIDSLFSSKENTRRNFEVSGTIASYTYGSAQSTIIAAMDESGSPYPGFVYRMSSATQFQLVVNAGTASTDKFSQNYSRVSDFKISRTDRVVSYNDTTVLNMSNLTKYFTVPLTIGSAYSDNAPFRFFNGEIKNTLVKVAYIKGNEVTLPQPTLTDCTFEGWTGSNGTTPQTVVTIPSTNVDDLSYTANFSCPVTTENTETTEPIENDENTNATETTNTSSHTPTNDVGSLDTDARSKIASEEYLEPLGESTRTGDDTLQEAPSPDAAIVAAVVGGVATGVALYGLTRREQDD